MNVVEYFGEKFWKYQQGGSIIRLWIKSRVIIVFYEDIGRIDVAKDVSIGKTEFLFSFTTEPLPLIVVVISLFISLITPLVREWRNT